MFLVFSCFIFKTDPHLLCSLVAHLLDEGVNAKAHFKSYIEGEEHTR